ncbi:MAG: PQQ-binding-like beta-propeller repeat protein [Phycisphaerae bacterium]
MRNRPVLIGTALLAVAIVCAPSLAAGEGDVPLIPTYGELYHDFGTMRRAAREGDYEKAIQWFQDRVDEPGKLTFRIGPGHHVSVRAAALSVLASLPAKGQEVYHRLYDEKARAMYRRAADQQDAAALWETLGRYPLTPAGGKAARMLGALAMDRGRFDEALWYWQQALAMAPDADGEGPLLARIAAAAHLGGRPKLADATTRHVRKEHAGQTVTWGGKQQTLGQFVEDIGRLRPRPQAALGKVWPSTGGSPLGWAHTSAAGRADLGGVLWCRPKQFAEADPNTEVLKHLAARTPIDRTYPHPSFCKWEAYLDRGRVWARYEWNSRKQVVDVPPVIRPIVTADRLTVRTDDGLVSRRLSDGKELWSCRLGLQRRLGGTRYGMTRFTDEGWYQLTSDGGRVFTIAGLLPTIPTRPASPGETKDPDPDREDTSALACVSLKDGTLLWRVGYGSKDAPDDLNMRKFHTAPLAADGLLYALALHRNMQQFRLICLRADTGKLVWDRLVCQSPPAVGGGKRNAHAFVNGTVPSLFARQVVACTNAGVIGAFDADTGRPIWLRRYETPLTQRRGDRRSLKNRRVNPLIIDGGTVVALPYDSEHLLAMDLRSGKDLWKAKRNKAARLTGVGHGRVLLTGEDGWRLLRVSDGKVVASDESIPLLGVPAVSADGAWVSTRDGRVLRLTVSTAKVVKVGTVKRGLLGNLLVLDGRLIAANAAGVCVYRLAD